MPYLALYRKYRPRKFEEVFGQAHVTQTLQNAIKSGRTAHAYLFCGPRGCGKTTTARLLAKAMNCINGPTPEPCDVCETCVQIREGSCVDVIEMDAASETGIDDVKETIIENAKYRPMIARYKVYIIDEVHDLSAKAFDALLKTIEEPPPHIFFVLATTEYQKVPATIRSRCQIHQFHRGAIADLVHGLERALNAEGIQAEPSALAAIARMSDGSYRDSLTLLEQVIAFGSENVTYEVVSNALGLVEDETLMEMLDAMAAKNSAVVLQGVDTQMRLGREPRTILESLIGKIRELVFVSHKVDFGEWLDPHRQALLHEQASRIGNLRLQQWWSKMASAAGQMRTAGSPRLWLELTLLDLMIEPAPEQEPISNKQPEPTPHPKPVFEKPRQFTPRETTEQKPSENVAEKPAQAPAGTTDTVNTASASTEKTETPINLEDCQTNWNNTLELLKRNSPAGAQILANSKVEKVENNRYTISLSSAMALEKVSEPKRKRYVEQTLNQYMKANNYSIEFIYVEPEAIQEPEPAIPVAAIPPAEGDELVRLTAEILDGDIVEDKKKKKYHKRTETNDENA